MDRDLCGTSYNRVNLIFFGEVLEVESLSKTIGFECSKSYRNGDLTILSSGTELKRKTGTWNFELKSEEGTLTSLLDDLLNRIPKNFSLQLDELGIQKSRIAIYRWQNDAEEEVNLDISSDAASQIANLKAEITFSCSVAIQVECSECTS